MDAPTLVNKEFVLVSILRAGNGLLEKTNELIPFARTGFIGLTRNPETLQPEQYCKKLPNNLATSTCILLDPMLATGNSSVLALTLLKEAGAKDIRLVCLVAAPEGVKKMKGLHPDVPIFTAAMDSHLNEHGYIVPGLGDAGDRIFGTEH